MLKGESKITKYWQTTRTHVCEACPLLFCQQVQAYHESREGSLVPVPGLTLWFPRHLAAVHRLRVGRERERDRNRDRGSARALSLSLLLFRERERGRRMKDRCQCLGKLTALKYLCQKLCI